MEITLQQILDAIGTNPSLIDGLIKPILESDKGKGALTAAADVLYKANIDTEIGKVHAMYDDNVFEVLGKRPATGADGKKEKTYDFIKKQLSELKRLSELETTLNENEKVKLLNQEIEKLKLSNGGDYWKGIFDSAKSDWEKEKGTLEQRATTAENAITTGAVALEIAKAKAGITFNPDVKENIRNIVLKNVEDSLLANAKVGDDGKVIFVDKDGKTKLNAKYEPISALEALMESPEIADIVLKDANPGGGAPPTTKTQISTTTVEGKDKKKLNVPAGTFKTQSEWIEQAEAGLVASGITMRDPLWDQLKNEAYKEQEVDKLPVQ